MSVRLGIETDFVIPLLLDRWSRISLFKTVSRSEYSMNLCVAASHERLYLCSGVRGRGSLVIASLTFETKSSGVLYVRQLGNERKNSFDGCSAQITNLPIARASAVAVQSTSLMLGFMNTLYLQGRKKNVSKRKK